MVQHTVLWFDVSVEHSPLVQVHHSQEGLSEVVPSQGLGKTADPVPQRKYTSQYLTIYSKGNNHHNIQLYTEKEINVNSGNKHHSLQHTSPHITIIQQRNEHNIQQEK